MNNGIILDTNVISAQLQAQENPAIKRWLVRQEPEQLYLTSVNLAEILFGIRKLAQGRRRQTFEAWVEKTLLPNFTGRILGFDSVAADAWADITTADRAIGKPRPLADSYIAAIALANGCHIATRNVRDYARLGLKLVNPWD